MDDTTGTGDADSTGSMNNNTNGKKVYTKASFSIYNIANFAGDTSDTSEKVSNNTNNIGEIRSGKVSEADKNILGGTNKDGLGETDIKARGGMGGTNKGGISGAIIEADKKAGARAVVSTDNSVDSSDKVTN